MKSLTLAVLVALVCKPLSADMTLQTFNETKNKEITKAYVTGLGIGIGWANGVMEDQYGKRLYCQPGNLVLGVENYKSMIEQAAKEAKATPDDPIEILLIRGLVETFPCKQPKP